MCVCSLMCACALRYVWGRVCTCVCAGTLPPPAPHQRGGDYPGYREELKIDGTQCDERHLVQQSQLPDNQSPCNSREEAAGTVSEGRSPEHRARGQRRADGAVSSARRNRGCSQGQAAPFSRRTSEGRVKHNDNPICQVGEESVVVCARGPSGGCGCSCAP